MAIPKILHQTWKTKDLPVAFERFRQTWLRHHPDWEFVLYDDADCRRLVATHYPALLPRYDCYPTNVQRADLFRYLVVHLHGGVYADLDMECLQPLTPLLENRSCVLGVEATFGDHLRRVRNYRRRYQVGNCIFAAAARHPFFSLLIDRLPKVESHEPLSQTFVEDTTGPGLLTRVFQECRDSFPDVTLLPQIHWLPPRIPGYPNCFPFNIHMYCKHHSVGTWKLQVPDTRSFRQRMLELWHPPLPWLREDFRPRQALAHLRRHLEKLRTRPAAKPAPAPRIAKFAAGPVTQDSVERRNAA
jgi:inositol phosphorylceramide mannosyltransferase catalytic subunit